MSEAPPPQRRSPRGQGTSPRLAFYGDDFTGSVDVLLQVARQGWAGRLFTHLPGPAALAEAARGCDAVGIAGIARSIPTGRLEAEVRPVLSALAALEPQVLQYKACSTADSSPQVGSLGRALEIGRALRGDQTVPLLFAQPDFGRYTAFGHHFAREGETVYRLDRQPTMSSHPVTPMDESDLAVHLGRQTDLAVAGLAFPAYTSADQVTQLIRSSDAAALVLDALGEEHLQLLGRAVLDLGGFAIGSGGLSHALASAEPGDAGPVPAATPARGPVLAVSGSRSAQTRRQIDAAARAGWMTAPVLAAGVREQALAALAAGRSVALSSDDADTAGLTPDEILPALARAAADVVEAAVRAGVGRVVVCGGDTSSRVTTLLGVESLSIAANPSGNVVLLRAHAPDPAVDGLELLLKGGQVGEVDLFEQVRTLGSEA
ncbi:four-carbon acid sugar kinase family protein [Ruania suaedae]|uniref:four-carbon acid sugar kinase family protein n=1 Tax=Ruania suaedae TaxID=2897774 RepID=UPI001E382F3B|nr:four-carbon acid sugar kinase family protein [Ruania suaedae]UFU02841.1 four-carbon acid sugar kinase family protein [Ruania suaedae]